MKNRTLRCAMAQKGFLTVSELAEEIGYSQDITAGVVTGRINSRRAKKIISLTLGKGVKELWPEKPSEAR